MSKEIDYQKMIDDALAKQKAELENNLRLRECNKIELGATVVELVEVLGKAIIDKETGLQKENNGVPAFYPNRYSVKISFNGGEIESPIKEADYKNLKIGSRYLVNGRLGEVKEFGSSSIKPIFSGFVQL